MIAMAVNDLLSEPMMKGVFGVIGRPGIIRLAEAAEVGDPIVLGDPECESGDPLRRHFSPHETLDRCELRCRPLPVGSRHVRARPAREVGGTEHQRDENHPYAGLPSG